jgi:hypothetical protein
LINQNLKKIIMSLNKNINAFLLFIGMATLLSIVACKKDSNDGAPTISRVRANLPSPNDSSLSKAGPGQWVVIEGAGFTTTTEVFFNGWPATFNPALFSDNSMVILIPADMPFASLEQSRLNTIQVITKHGEITYTFPIEPPPPIITGMSNEMALADETVTITGNNFFFIDKVIFPDNKEVTTGIVTNATGTTLTLKVPAGITSGGPVKVVNRYGTGTSVLLFNDVVTGMLHNYDNVNNFDWGAGSSSSSTDFPGNRGTYGVMNANSIAGGDFGWWNGNRSVNTKSVAWVPAAELGNPVENYAFKFEVSIRKPWSAGTVMIVKDYNWTYVARYEPWVAAGGPFTVGGWQTVTIPLTLFKTKANNADGTGSPASSLATLLGSGSGSAHFFFVNPGSSTVQEFEAAIDNIRVVKIK